MVRHPQYLISQKIYLKAHINIASLHLANNKNYLLQLQPAGNQIRMIIIQGELKSSQSIKEVGLYGFYNDFTILNIQKMNQFKSSFVIIYILK